MKKSFDLKEYVEIMGSTESLEKWKGIVEDVSTELRMSEGHAYKLSASKGWNGDVIEHDMQDGLVGANFVQFICKDGGEVMEGFTNEQLYMVLIDRLTKLNNKFPCKENEDQIKLLQQSLGYSCSRIIDRYNRSVLGEHKV